MSRFTGLQFTGLPCLPVFFFRATPSPRFTGGMPVYRGGSFFHARGAPPAAAHSHTRCCTQHNTTRWVLRAAANTCLHTMPCVAGELSCVPLNGWCCHAMDLVMNNDKHFMFLGLFQWSALLVHLKHCCRNWTAAFDVQQYCTLVH